MTLGRSLGIPRRRWDIACWSDRPYFADDLATWLAEDAADGFNVICDCYPGPLEDFCRLVVPELQRRGVFRCEYTGARCATISVLPVPENR